MELHHKTVVDGDGIRLRTPEGQIDLAPGHATLASNVVFTIRIVRP
jgi:hypothetical protein